MATTVSYASWLNEQREFIKGKFAAAARSGVARDVVFVGNSGDSYPWDPCDIIDLDICVFVEERDHQTGEWLAALRDELVHEMDRRGIDCELRLVRGPYKKTALKPTRPCLTIHLSLFTETLYKERPILLRYDWRKFRCIIEPDRLSRLAPPRPSREELLKGRGGVIQKLNTIVGGIAPFVEYTLPDFEEITWSARRGEPLFSEYCLNAVSYSARNHARVMGFLEADLLTNNEFFIWYPAALLDSQDYRECVAIKRRVRQTGYDDVPDSLPTQAAGYLTSLATELSSV